MATRVFLILSLTFWWSGLAVAQDRPNIVYFLVDNLGYGELGSYGGGVLRGAPTPRIDKLADEGLQLLNFNVETQCTPSRSALMTGRYSIRSGNASVKLAGDTGGLVAWERTLGDILSDAGYATAIVGKWHIGASKGRWPTDHGFDEWIGVPRSYDEALWPSDPWYDPKRDPVTYVLESTKGKEPKNVEQLTVDVKLKLDVEYMRRSKDFIDRSVAAKKPFFLYFNHTLMHFPTAPREEFRGRTGHGPWADSLAQLDSDFGELLDYLEKKGVADNTIVIFSGDNGPEGHGPWRGDPGIWEGSYFTGMEGSLRTPGFVRYPGVVPAGRRSNEIVHITDMFTTLVLWAGAKVPGDRIIDGVDQRPFFEGRVDRSARDGFPYWNSDRMYGVKWRNFKVVNVLQKYLDKPFLELAVPHIVNLDVDPKERKPYDYPYFHSWVIAHSARIITEFNNSLKKEELIPPGAPLDFVPGPAKSTQ